MSGTATEGKDYTLSGAHNQVTIPAGQSSTTVTLHSMEDTDEGREGDEPAILTLHSGSGYKLTNSSATITLTP